MSVTKYQIRFSVFKEQVSIGRDASGEGLYKRGYRAVGVEAPLRETLAAALVTLSRYRGGDPFCDPFHRVLEHLSRHSALGVSGISTACWWCLRCFLSPVPFLSQILPPSLI